MPTKDLLWIECESCGFPVYYMENSGDHIVCLKCMARANTGARLLETGGVARPVTEEYP